MDQSELENFFDQTLDRIKYLEKKLNRVWVLQITLSVIGLINIFFYDPENVLDVAGLKIAETPLLHLVLAFVLLYFFGEAGFTMQNYYRKNLLLQKYFSDYYKGIPKEDLADLYNPTTLFDFFHSKVKKEVTSKIALGFLAFSFGVNHFVIVAHLWFFSLSSPWIAAISCTVVVIFLILLHIAFYRWVPKELRQKAKSFSIIIFLFFLTLVGFLLWFMNAHQGATMFTLDFPPQSLFT